MTARLLAHLVFLIPLTAIACGGTATEGNSGGSHDGTPAAPDAGPPQGTGGGTSGGEPDGGSRPECDLEAIETPTIIVSNGLTGDPVCDASVTASGPYGALTLALQTTPDAGPGVGCTYAWVAGQPSPGSYTLTVSASGFATSTSQVTVVSCGCASGPCFPETDDSVALTPM